MNIFILDNDPLLAAVYQCDLHVNKMIIESAQMLANAYDPKWLGEAPKTKTGKIRSYSYLHHPCSKWVMQSLDNWQWLLAHAEYLIDEKLYRTKKRHFTSDFIWWCGLNPPLIQKLGLTPFCKCVDEEFKKHDTIQAYRKYYKKKQETVKMDWTGRDKPEWMY